MDIQNNKWVKMQVARILMFLLFLFIFPQVKSQTLLPTNNKGGYLISEISSDQNQTIAIKIYGKALNLKDNKEIEGAIITFACTSIKTNKNGEFEFIVNNNDLKTNYLKIVALGFKTVETGFFSINPKISLEINFYLEEDDKPFINCADN